jgi:hypothetical protein
MGPTLISYSGGLEVSVIDARSQAMLSRFSWLPKAMVTT